MALDPRGYMTLDSAYVPYDNAGAFVTFLLLRHGPEKFVALTTQLESGANYAMIDKVFGQVYGVALDSEVEVFIDNSYCDDEFLFNVRPYDCVASEIQWRDAVWSWQTTTDCEDVHVVGGISPEMDFLSQRSATLNVPNSGQYELAIKATRTEHAMKMTIGSCFGCPWYPKDVVVMGDSTTLIHLAAGKYFLRVTGYAEEVSEIEAMLTPR